MLASFFAEKRYLLKKLNAVCINLYIPEFICAESERIVSSPSQIIK